ncbi:MAG: response regulator transcription factor, partial [Acidobacteria bacterium]|nr:response regulator transcription factor [Acidobacteriota bacterium]
MSRPRVLIADDHKLLVEAFVSLLENEVEVVGKVLDGRALLKEAPRLKPDIIVLDISMPKLNGLEAGEQLKHIMPDVKLIFLTMHEDPDLAVEAFRIGASGYLLKSSAASELFQAVQEVSRGRSYVTPQIAQGMLESFAQGSEGRSVSKLTARQREILQLLAEGNTMKEVASTLNIAPRTVAF